MFVRTLAATALATLMLTTGASAQTQERTVLREGAAQLPTSGLVIDLVAQNGVEYHVSGSWSFDVDTNAFDTRDVIDEIRVSDQALRAGNWILTGYFTAGGCTDVLANVSLDNAWTQQAALWGESWQVHGGVFTFSGDLGRRPAAVLCRAGQGGRSLLLHRFITSASDGLSQAEIMRDVSGSRVLENASRSFATKHAQDIAPLRRADVRSRGPSPAVRSIKLEKSGLVVDLPDDGFFWHYENDGEIDYLDRLLPTLPEIAMEIFAAEDVECQDIFAAAAEDLADHKPTGLPDGWVAGPTLLVDGEVELLLCAPVAYGALAVGLFQGETDKDVTRLHPILQALANADY